MSGKEIELTDKQRTILEHMDRITSNPMRSSLKSKEVARKLDCRTTSLSSDVQQLEKKGLIDAFKQTTAGAVWRVNSELADPLLAEGGE